MSAGLSSCADKAQEHGSGEAAQELQLLLGTHLVCALQLDAHQQVAGL